MRSVNHISVAAFVVAVCSVLIAAGLTPAAGESDGVGGTELGQRAAVGVADKPASASYDVPTVPAGWTKLQEQWMYLPVRHVVRHIDQQHSNEDGFWYATTQRVPSGELAQHPRGFVWNYQPYGVKCDNANLDLGWNPWANRYWCSRNADKVEAAAPGYLAYQKRCREQEQQPWKEPVQNWDESWSNSCDNGLLNPETVPLLKADSQHYTCAPWEVEQAGQFECENIRYPWQNNVVKDWWVPAPDSCTGAHRDWNRPEFERNFRTLATNVPDCKGQDLAPNCNSAVADNAACGGPVVTGEVSDGNGAAEGMVRVFAERTTSVSVRATGTATRTATARSLRQTVRTPVVRKVRGKRVKRFGRAAIYTNGRATVTRTGTGTMSGQVVGAAHCDRPSYDEAKRCAEQLAYENAQKNSDGSMLALAQMYANQDAADRAERDALTAAQRASRTAMVTPAMLATAKRQARAAALRAIRKA